MTDEHWTELFARLDRLERVVIALAAYLDLQDDFHTTEAQSMIRCLDGYLSDVLPSSA